MSVLLNSIIQIISTNKVKNDYLYYQLQQFRQITLLCNYIRYLLINTLRGVYFAIIIATFKSPIGYPIGEKSKINMCILNFPLLIAIRSVLVSTTTVALYQPFNNIVKRSSRFIASTCYKFINLFLCFYHNHINYQQIYLL